MQLQAVLRYFLLLNSMLVLANCKWIDLSRSYENGMLSLGTQYQHTLTFEGQLKNSFRCIPYIINYDLKLSEHTGTHMDAPLHFSQGKWTIEQIPVENLVGEAIVVDVSARTAKNRTYNLTVRDLKRWEWKHGRIPRGSILLVRYGWGKFWGDNEQYLGTSTTNPQLFRFPGIGGRPAKWLVKNRSIKGVGVDSFTLDSPQSLTFPAHQTFLENNIYGLENIANMDKLPAKGATLYVLPMKIKDGGGAPTRILAQTNVFSRHRRLR